VWLYGVIDCPLIQRDTRYVRMLASPALYNVGADYMEGDAPLVQKRGKFVVASCL
jgi:hypothetical protein